MCRAFIAPSQSCLLLSAGLPRWGSLSRQEVDSCHGLWLYPVEQSRLALFPQELPSPWPMHSPGFRLCSPLLEKGRPVLVHNLTIDSSGGSKKSCRPRPRPPADLHIASLRSFWQKRSGNLLCLDYVPVGTVGSPPSVVFLV